MNEAAQTTPSAAGRDLDVNRSLATGGAWMLGLRWGLRGLGLVNTLVLARLLTPADFGLVAMAMVVIGMIEMLGQTGQGLALIRIPNPTRDHYDSAWTLTLIIAAGLTLVLWAIAPLAAMYYHEPRAEFMVRLMTLRTLMGGFQNIGVIDFRRDLRFAREFSFQFLQRALVIAVTIVAAVALRDWRALVIGILGGQFLGIISSYMMSPYRPRPCVRRIPQMLAFSLWTLVTAIAQYINGRADQFVIGGITGAGALGIYNVAEDAATRRRWRSPSRSPALSFRCSRASRMTCGRCGPPTSTCSVPRRSCRWPWAAACPW
jgi:O-antigen/teichoic acid export membrane protein